MVIGKTTMLLLSHPVYLLLAKRNFVHCVSELEYVYFIYYPKSIRVIRCQYPFCAFGIVVQYCMERQHHKNIPIISKT